MRTGLVLEDAEIVALGALTFLADSPPDLARFVLHSGLDPAQVSQRARERDFLAGVVDFLLGDDELLLRFCESESLEPRTVHLVRECLSPGSRSRE